MGRGSKKKKAKIPKLTEAQYAAYLSSLKEGEERPQEHLAMRTVSQAEEEKRKLH